MLLSSISLIAQNGLKLHIFQDPQNQNFPLGSPLKSSNQRGVLPSHTYPLMLVHCMKGTVPFDLPT